MSKKPATKAAPKKAAPKAAPKKAATKAAPKAPTTAKSTVAKSTVAKSTVKPKADKTDEERAASMPERQEPESTAVDTDKAPKEPKAPKPEPITREPPAPAKAKSGSNLGPKLAEVVNRLELLEGEKKEIADDIKAVMTAAKGDGLNPKTIKEILRMRKRDAGKLREEMDELDNYMLALGMI